MSKKKTPSVELKPSADVIVGKTVTINLPDIKVKKLNKNAVIPTKAFPLDAGFDLTAIKKEIISSSGVKILSTGIAIEIPEGWYGQIAERSGFSIKNTLKLKAGIIDSSYRGEVGIVVQNCGDFPVTIEAGTKVAQLLFLPVPVVNIVESEDLSSSDRGTNGFGSTDNQ